MNALSSRLMAGLSKKSSVVDSGSTETHVADSVVPVDGLTLSSRDMKDSLRTKLAELGASERLKAMYKKQGTVEVRKQERWANASFELALEPGARAQEVEGVFQLIESGLADPTVQVTKSKNLGGGMNATKLVTLSNGLTAVWKPSQRKYTGRARQNVPAGTEDERELAAYLVDKRLGHLAKVPPTVLRELDGERGVLTFFVGNSAPSDQRQDIANIHLFEPEETLESPIALLDYVIGNLDRHRQNWMISRTKQAIPIDHDLTFPEVNGDQDWANYNFHRPLTVDLICRRKLEAFSEQRDVVSAELEPLVGKSAVGAMFGRVEMLLSSGKSGTEWLGETRVKKRHASVLGYLTSHNYSIKEIPGLNSQQSEALREAGIPDSKTLLEEFASPSSRAGLKSRSGTALAHAFNTQNLLTALNKADLMRVEGVGPQYAELLHEAGVDTVPELAVRNASTLVDKLEKISGHGLAESSVKEWVRKAKLMRRRINY